MFGEVEKLKTGMDATWKRSEVILNNMANADVPGFKRSTVRFEEYYQAALMEGDSAFKLKQTREKHIDIGSANPPVMQVETDTSTSMRMDENNVDIETEMTDLTTTVLQYQTLQTKLVGEFGQLRIAITGGQ